MAADLALLAVVVARLVSCSTVENCAICAVHCELSCGDDGSWCCSCATRSLRNASLSSDAMDDFFVAEAGAVTAAVVMSVMAMAVTRGRRRAPRRGDRR